MKDRKSTRLNSSHLVISYAVFCLKKKTRSSHFFFLNDTAPPEIPPFPLPAPLPICPIVGPPPRRTHRAGDHQQPADREQHAAEQGEQLGVGEGRNRRFEQVGEARGQPHE